MAATIYIHLDAIMPPKNQAPLILISSLPRSVLLQYSFLEQISMFYELQPHTCPRLRPPERGLSFKYNFSLLTLFVCFFLSPPSPPSLLPFISPRYFFISFFPYFLPRFIFLSLPTFLSYLRRKERLSLRGLISQTST